MFIDRKLPLESSIGRPSWRLLVPLLVVSILSACPPNPPDLPAPNPPNPPATDVAPQITLQPASQSVTAPAIATFTTAASGTPAPTLQWQLSTDGVTYNNIAGATSSSYSTSATTVTNSGYRYRAVATNRVSSATSNVAVLTVTAASAAPAITSQPLSQSVTEPAAATFSVTATGNPAVTYQWQLSTDGVTYNNIGGATGSSYGTGATSVAQSGRRYRVVVTNAVASITSDAAILTVAAAPIAPAITSQPASQTISEPNTATFTVIATGSPTPTYQWQLSTDGNTFNNVAGANSSSYTTGVTSIAQSGRLYRVVVSNVAGTQTSDSATLSVTGTPSGATIIFSRNNGTVNVENTDLYSIREVNGTEIQLTNSTDNEGLCGVTPDGRAVYQRAASGSVDIYSVKLDGTDRRPVAVTSDDEVCTTLVSGGPAAGRVIYSRRSTTTGARDIYAVNADGTQPTPLANGPLNEDFNAITENYRVIFSVDTTQSTDLYSVDLEGLSVAPLATSYLYESYSGSRAGLVVYGTYNFVQTDVYTVGELGVGAAPFAASASADEDLVGITPGGAFLIMSRDLATGGRTLYANSTPLASGSASITYLGSTTQRVLYSKWVSGDNFDLYSVGVDGTGAAVLASSADGEGLAFITPNGKAIVSRYAITGPTVTLGDLYAINLDGTGQVTLTNNPDHDSFAALIGNQVIYQREIANSVNNVQLWAVNLDGTNNRRFYQPGGPAYYVGATPSGRVLVDARHQLGRDVYIVEADGTGARQLAPYAGLVAVVP